MGYSLDIFHLLSEEQKHSPSPHHPIRASASPHVPDCSVFGHKVCENVHCYLLKNGYLEGGDKEKRRVLFSASPFPKTWSELEMPAGSALRMTGIQLCDPWSMCFLLRGRCLHCFAKPPLRALSSHFISINVWIHLVFYFSFLGAYLKSMLDFGFYKIFLSICLRDNTNLGCTGEMGCILHILIWIHSWFPQVVWLLR